MRQIKFKAQDIASNKWLYGDLRHHKDDVCIFEQGGNNGKQVKRDTIGQFTGMTDKNGKRIFEGDIVVQHADDMPDIRGVVAYDETNARYGMAFTDLEGITNFDTLSQVKCYSDRNRVLSYEVIGNVHDNPELIKQH